MTRDNRAAIYKDTVEIAKAGGYTAPSGKEIKFDNKEEMVKGTIFYSKLARVNYDQIPRFDTSIKVVNQDCLMAALDLIQSGEDMPLVLNMASFSTPGGGVERGSAAQEENLFRRTNLFQSLYGYHNIGINYQIKQKEERYPLNYNFGAIYTPFVTVFKDGEDKNYSLREEPFTIAVASVSAIKRPPLTKNGELEDWVKDVTRNKIRQILSLALANRHTSIVLSAFGCGAYGTPPSEMAKLFDEVLNLDAYRGAFKNVVFAIIDDHNAFGEHNPKGNLLPFKEVLEKQNGSKINT